MKGFFVTGIGTAIGKTIVSTILTEALHADYWKPIQAGNLEDSDTDFVLNNLTNPNSHVHAERYRLNTPASPHQAAIADGVTMNLEDFSLPETDRHLIVEGAGGLMVPINEKDLIIDLISHLELPVILVAGIYLGSINHTLLSFEALRSRHIHVAGIVFNGPPNPATVDIILKHTGLHVILRVNEEEMFDQDVISRYANEVRIG
ncbi:dethiobiotin synthase [soil metagenome]